MKAIVYRQYGSPDVLEFADVEKPVASAGRVVVRVKAAALNPYDWHYMRGEPVIIRLMSGLFRPKREGLGADFAGVVESVGDGVTSVKPGDEVYGESHGALAEYVSAKASVVVPKPANLSFEEASAIPMTGLTALQALRDHGKLKAGERLLVNGASGGVGTCAVQIGKAMGAYVTGVCSGKNAEMVKSLGADRVIDYTEEEFTSGDEKYDVILDNIGNKKLSETRRALVKGGRNVGVGADGAKRGFIIDILKTLLYAPFVKEKFISFIARPSGDDLRYLKELCESGRLRPVLDRTYPLEQTEDAMHYLETRHVAGKVVVAVQGGL